MDFKDRSVNSVRRTFIDFFVKEKGHTFVASSPSAPLDDPTLPKAKEVIKTSRTITINPS